MGGPPRLHGRVYPRRAAQRPHRQGFRHRPRRLRDRARRHAGRRTSREEAKAPTRADR